MKAAFLNPPIFTNEGGILKKWVRAGSRWPQSQDALCRADQWQEGHYIPYPFWLAHAASYTQANADCTIILRDSIALHESYGRFYAYCVAENPDIIFIESSTPTWEHDKGVIAGLHERLPQARIAICGPIAHPASGKQPEILALPGVVAALAGEYEKGCVRVVNGQTGAIPFEALTKDEMNAAPFPWQDAATIWRYHDACPLSPVMPQAQVYTSRGCLWKCLSGDTPINTVYGMIPIKELAETRETVGVFAYDPIEKRARVCTAKNIRKTGEEQSLVRVHFDDGSHIDCTTDHQFLAFKWGNQHTGEKEWVCEAQDLKRGMHLRAIKTYITGQKGDEYVDAAWSRRGRTKLHRLVMEWKVGRPLADEEQVHHDDRNKLNNLPDNLLLKSGQKDHFAAHPEIAERMRTNNPTKNGFSEEWRARISAANTGKVRTPESRERYRQAAIKREASRRQAKSSGIVNHRVLSIEPLAGVHDTYCLEVAETGWFYANNVLVHNCDFCSFPAVMSNDDADGKGKRTVRHYTPEYLERYVSELVTKYRIRSVYFDDDTGNLGAKHMTGLCAVMKKLRLPWAMMCRADTCTREMWQLMQDSGCYGVKIGFESGVQSIVDKMGKRLDIAEARRTVIFLRNLGLSIHTTWTLGHPGETKEEMKATMDFMKTVPHNSCQISGTALLDGTPLAAADAAMHLAEGFDRDTDGAHKAKEILAELATL